MVKRSFEEIVRAFNEAAVPFIVVGGLAPCPSRPSNSGIAWSARTLRREKGMIVLKFWSDAHRQTPIDMFVTEPFDFAREYEAALVENLPPDCRSAFFATILLSRKSAGCSNNLADVRELELLRTGRYED